MGHFFKLTHYRRDGKRRPSWLNSYRAEKEKAQEVQRYQRGEGGVAGRAGDAQAGEARGEQEARQERQAQTQSGKVTGGRRSRVKDGCAIRWDQAGLP